MHTPISALASKLALGMMSVRKSETFVEIVGHHAAWAEGEYAVFRFGAMDEFVWS